LDAMQIIAFYKSRFQIEFLFRDGKALLLFDLLGLFGPVITGAEQCFSIKQQQCRQIVLIWRKTCAFILPRFVRIGLKYLA
jgi:hypothetical protein